jgi:hypothetical protein
LDTIKKSVSPKLPGKIALTSSIANFVGEIDFDNLNLEKGNYWIPLKAYGNTKLMVNIFSKSFNLIVKFLFILFFIFFLYFYFSLFFFF